MLPERKKKRAGQRLKLIYLVLYGVSPSVTVNLNGDGDTQLSEEVN